MASSIHLLCGTATVLNDIVSGRERHARRLDNTTNQNRSTNLNPHRTSQGPGSPTGLALLSVPLLIESVSEAPSSSALSVTVPSGSRSYRALCPRALVCLYSIFSSACSFLVSAMASSSQPVLPPIHSPPPLDIPALSPNALATDSATDTPRPTRPGLSVFFCVQCVDPHSFPVHTNVLARLQALFPSAPHSQPNSSPLSPEPVQVPPPVPPKPPPKFIKLRLLTWNMHDSLPKVFPSSQSSHYA